MRTTTTPNLEKHIRFVEADEGAPILELLCEYAEMGYSRTFVARLWGFDPGYFRSHIVRKLDPEGRAKWRPTQHTLDWRERFDEALPNRVAGIRHRLTKRYSIGDAALTAIEIAKITGLEVTSVHSRLSRGVRGRALLRPPARRSV